jgi:hypothetical protein
MCDATQVEGAPICNEAECFYGHRTYLLVSMPVPDCGRVWRIWRRRTVGNADDFGLYAGDACLARGRFVTNVAARKFQTADVSGGSGATGLSATRTFWASTPATPVWRADGLAHPGPIWWGIWTGIWTRM